MLRAHVLARIVFDAWRAAGQTLEGWRELQPVLHEEFALLVEEAYHETNRWLMEQGVLPEVDLRPFIRRSRRDSTAPVGWQAGTGHAVAFGRRRGCRPAGYRRLGAGGARARGRRRDPA